MDTTTYSTQGATERSTSSFKFAPVNPEMGMNATSVFMLYPEPLRKGESLPTISSYLSSEFMDQRFAAFEIFMIRQDAPRLVPVDGGVIHLVDDDDQFVDTGRLDEHGVLAGLSTLLESSLEFSLSRGDDENGGIGLRGTGDHLRDVGFVARGVENGVSASVRLEVGTSDFDGFTLTLAMSACYS